MDVIENNTSESTKRPVVYIEFEETDKEALRKIAKSKGLQLIPLCRMVLLEYLKNNKE